MENVYTSLELSKPNFFQRLLKKAPERNAIIEINNLLAAKPLKEIRLDDIETISTKYKVDLHKKFIADLKRMYESYLKACFEDSILTNDEIADLNYLKHLLILKDNEVEELHNKIASKIIESHMKKLLVMESLKNLNRSLLINYKKT